MSCFSVWATSYAVHAAKEKESLHTLACVCVCVRFSATADNVNYVGWTIVILNDFLPSSDSNNENRWDAKKLKCKRNYNNPTFFFARGRRATGWYISLNIFQGKSHNHPEQRTSALRKLNWKIYEGTEIVDI